MSIIVRVVAALCLLAGLSLSVFAQSRETMPSPVTVSRSRTTTRTTAALIQTVDIPSRSVTLQLISEGLAATSGETVVAFQDTLCPMEKNGRVASLVDFTVGERVVARLTWRTSPQPVVILREMYDSTSYTEREREGKDTCIGIVSIFTPTTISVRRNDGTLIDFRVTEKSRLVFRDAPATMAAFPVGAAVAVKPRRLPGGDVMATIIGSNVQEVAWAYRDSLTTWQGSITGVQGDEQNGAVVSIQREDGAIRRFLLPVGARFVQGRSVLPWRLLTGATVSVHLIKDAEKNSMRYADEIKIASRRTRSTTDSAIMEP